MTRWYGRAETAEKWSSSMTRTWGCSARIARRSAARSSVRLAPVGLWARGVQTTARAPDSRAARSVGAHTGAVDRDGRGAVTAQPQRPDARQEAGVLDRHQISAGEVSVEQPLGGVDRSVRHQRAERLVDVLGEVGAGPGIQPRVDRGLSVQRRAVVPAPGGAQEVGQQQRVGITAGQVDAVAPDTGSDTLPRELRHRRDHRAAAPRVSATPASTSRRYARATVFRLTPSSAASTRTGGRLARGANSPEATWSRTLPAISAAVLPLMPT